MKLNDGYMRNLSKLSTTTNLSWFKSWFDSSFYHQLYAHRSDKEAADFIDNLISVLQPVEEAKMLDLGCGAGRHVKYLAAKGCHVTGLDLASSSILYAKKFEQSNLQFFQHDMRVAFGKDYFDYVLNFFTSFGYFDNDAENSKVIHNISQSLKKDGILVMDYLNAEVASDSMVAKEEKEIDGVAYQITRWMDDKHFFKKIKIDLQSGQPFEYTEKVARFYVKDFEAMFSDHKLSIESTYGDYELNEFNIGKSPRLILVAKKG